MVGEVGRRADKSFQFQNFDDGVQAFFGRQNGTGVFQLGQQVDGAQARGGASFFNGQAFAQTAFIDDGAFFRRQLSRNVKRFAAKRPTDIIGDGGGDFGKENVFLF